ncbi:hypothetical protein AB0K29_32600, partial [Micromonospora humida]
MTVTRPLRRPPSAPVVLTLLVAFLLVVAALVDAVAPLAATTMAGAGGCAVAAARLLRLTAGDGRDRRVRRRRAAVLLTVAAAVVGATVAVLPLAPAFHRAEVAAVGLGAATLGYALGLLLLPGHSRLTPRARWRRGVDILGLGAALLFAGWVLVPPGPVPPVVRSVTVAGAVVLAGLLVGALDRHYPGTARCRLGVAAVLLGLADLVVLLAYRAPAVALLTAVPLLVGGALLTAAGMTRAAAGDPAVPTGPSPAWPRVTAPAAVATVAAAGHLAFVGGFTPTAVLLGLAVIPPLVARVSEARDDSGPARHGRTGRSGASGRSRGRARRG